MKILIADDEKLIRNGMTTILDWESQGHKIVGAVEDGLQALDYIKSNDVDILITDIRMPLLDGLELIREVKNVKPDLICIILSGYDEFEYARAAIDVGAFAYLLKPVDSASLIGLVEKAKNEILNRQEILNRLIRNLKMNQSSTLLDKNLDDENLANIEQAADYIKKNFTDSSTSLCSVAKFIGYEPTYFSKLFKKKNNISFVNFMIDLRIEKAKELLEGGVAAKDVCFMVGYESYPYFSKLFKEMTGMSPRQYYNKSS